MWRQVAENEAVLERAAAVQRELAAAMRDVFKDGVVFVLPALPAVPPRRRWGATHSSMIACPPRSGCLRGLPLPPPTFGSGGSMPCSW